MKKITILSLMTVGLFSLNSCITMQSVSISDVKPSTGIEVNASADGMGYLHLGVPRDLVEIATNTLKNKGAVGNVSTVMTMREWGIIQFYRVIAKGTTDATIKGVNDLTTNPNNTITNKATFTAETPKANIQNIPVDKKADTETKKVESTTSKSKFNVGDTVKFYDLGSNSNCKGTIIEMKSKVVVIEYTSFNQKKTVEKDIYDVSKVTK